MSDYKLLKVKIGLKPNGQADYPDFNLLQVVQDSGTDWSYYISANGLGWSYDKKYGHQDQGVDSPVGMQWGVIIADEVFVDEATSMFPDDCTAMDEAEFETFYEARSTAQMAEEDFDDPRIAGLRGQLELLLLLDQNEDFPNSPGVRVRDRVDEVKAQLLVELDPNVETGAVKKNKRKKWADFKASKGAVILPPGLGVIRPPVVRPRVKTRTKKQK